MRSVDHWEAGNVEQNHPASAGKIVRNATSRSKDRKGNDAYRVREHSTEAEMDKLLGVLKRNRHGHRDWLIGSMSDKGQTLLTHSALRVNVCCSLDSNRFADKSRLVVMCQKQTN